MKKSIRAFLPAVIFAVMFFLLTACGGMSDSDEKKPEPMAKKVYAYKSISKEVTYEIKGEFEHFCFTNGIIYYLSEYDENPEDGYSEYYLNVSDIERGVSASYPLESNNAYISSPVFESEDTGYYAEICQTENECKYSLVKINGKGCKTGNVDITDAVTEHTPNLYPSILEVIGNYIYIGGYNGIIILDKSGKFINSITEINSLSCIASDKNEKAYAYIWNGAEYDLCGIDVNAGILEKSLPVPFDGYNNIFINGKGSGYDFFVSDGTSLFGYNIGEEKSELFKWIEAGVSTVEMADVFYAGDETFICAGKSYPYGCPKFYKVNKQLAEKTDKKEILLAGTEYSISPLIENNIVKFNNASDKYYITVKKYPYDKIDELNLDIISGKVPDIFISNSEVPIDNYISKGLFADLYEFIDGDNEIRRSDFVPNLLTACETEGKLCRFPESFKIYTVIGKSSIFGDNMGITAKRLSEIASKYPADTEILPASAKEDIIRSAMELSSSEYIDFKNGTCNFDSDSFVSVLEFANTFMDIQDLDKYFDDNFWKRYNTMYSDESALLMLCYLTGYADIYNFEKKHFGEKVTAVGFPVNNGVGTSFIIDTGLSISEKSSVKEGAWEFVRTIFLPEYQDCSDCFSVRNDSLEKAANAAMKYDPKRDSYSIVLMGQMMLSSDTSELGEPCREDIDRVNEIIAAANGIMTCDNSIMDIILEETNGYFNGIRSAKEAAELIQMRVTIYLNEKS